jgi:hypothetical protein
MYVLFVLSCMQVAALPRLIPSPRGPTDCVNDLETENQPRPNKGL